jgi:hypothetical protein
MVRVAVVVIIWIPTKFSRCSSVVVEAALSPLEAEVMDMDIVTDIVVDFPFERK